MKMSHTLFGEKVMCHVFFDANGFIYSFVPNEHVTKIIENLFDLSQKSVSVSEKSLGTTFEMP